MGIVRKQYRRRLATPEQTIVEGAWIGDLPAGAMAPLNSATPAGPIGSPLHWTPRPCAGFRKQGERSLNLAVFVRLAADSEDLAIGETRLVGRIDQELAGMEVEPAASQHHFDAMIVAHLTYPSRPTPEPDVNGPSGAAEVEWTPEPPDENQDGQVNP